MVYHQEPLIVVIQAQIHNPDLNAQSLARIGRQPARHKSRPCHSCNRLLEHHIYKCNCEISEISIGQLTWLTVAVSAAGGALVTVAAG